MHATYYFLACIDNYTDAEAQDIYDAIESDFREYAEYCCDENNSWTIQGAVLADDRQMVLSQASTQPGQSLEPRFSTVPDCWKHAWRQAYQAVASDMAFWMPGSGELDHWSDRLTEPGLTANDIGALIRNEIPKRLAAEYSALADRQVSACPSLTGYQRSRIARAFELYLMSESDGKAPFSSEYAAPYDYPAFELYSGEEPNAILMVDIHT